MNDEFKPLPDALHKRWQNTAGKYTVVEDFLPELNEIDLTVWKSRPLGPRVQVDQELGRQNINHQVVLLKNQFAGQPEILYWHTLCISYLRRNTQLQSKASAIFRLLWEKECDFLLSSLSPRWIVSALQTFYDHGIDEGEKIAGSVGFFYGNLIKIYETERNTMREKLPENILPRTYKNLSVPGLFGFVPGDDILININAMAYGAAMSGGLASAPLLHLLKIVYNSNTIFSRSDSLSEVKRFRAHPNFTLSFDGRLHNK